MALMLERSMRALTFACRAIACSAIACSEMAIIAPFAACAADMTVILDEARILRLPDKVATIVIGNPLIADASLQAGGMVVITGKGYGATNLVVLDRAGAVLMEKTIEVQGPREHVVVVYRGIERETYSCTPKCERRITFGDSNVFFDAVINQSGTRNVSAQGAVPTK